MGLVGEVVDVETDGNVKVDPGGGDASIADHFSSSGDDSPPLVGDNVALTDGSETGTQQVTGYSDPDNDGVAAKGEKRSYARSSDGTPVAEVYLKGDGSIVIKSLLPAGADVLLAGATDFVALAAKVDAIVSILDTVLRTWVVAPADGGLALQAAYKLAFPLPPASVAAAKVKAE